MTIVLVTNLVQQAHRLADHVAFLNDSRLIEVGTTEHIFSEHPARAADVRLRAGTLRMSDRRPRRRALSISTRDLNLWYGDFQALKHVTVDIREGHHHRR